MKQLFYYADKYIQQSTWKDFALLKFCLFAMGVLVGIHIPQKNRKPVGIAAVAVFAATYSPDGQICFRCFGGGYGRGCAGRSGKHVVLCEIVG